MTPQVAVFASAQALRAAVTALIPISLVTLFAWASVGSGTGDPGDALRTSGVVWLAAHHVLFTVHTVASSGADRFWFLPIGALVVPYLTLRGAGIRIARELRGERVESLVVAAITLCFSYAVVCGLVSGLIRTDRVIPHPVVAFAFGFVSALLFGVPRILHVSWPVGVKFYFSTAAGALKALIAVSTLLVIASSIVNFAQIRSIVEVLRVGIISGILLTLISLLYLPNFAVWALAYLSGAGFGFGRESVVSPWTTQVDAVPTFPLFAAIPAGPPPYAFLLPVFTLLVFVVVGFTRLRPIEYRQAWREAARMCVVMIPSAVILTVLSGGPLLGGSLSAVGPSIWKFPLLLGAQTFFGIAVGATLRILVGRLRPIQRLKRS